MDISRNRLIFTENNELSSMKDTLSFLVKVRCATFNQHKYIIEALDGICKQQTNFPFICNVVDDASTDGEQEILNTYIREHFDEIESDENDDYTLHFAHHRENNNCYVAFIYLKKNHWSNKISRERYFNLYNNGVKYVTYCEGDDFWTSEHKLQKQTDFLETHPDYSGYYSNVEVICENGDKNPKDQKLHPLFPSHTIYKENPYFLGLNGQTATICVRREVCDKSVALEAPNINGDIKVSLTARAMGHVFYDGEILAKYRRGYNNFSWTAQNASKFYSANVLRTRMALFDISAQLGKKYINRKSFLSSFITIKIIKTAKHPNKQNIKELAQMIKDCDFKLSLPFYIIKETYNLYRPDKEKYALRQREYDGK